MEEPMSLDEQSTLVVDFLDGLVDAFDLDAGVIAERVDEGTMEMRVENSEGVGLLIGPKGNTLRSIEDINGVSTVSEGQEPRRWVVIVPD